MFETNFYTQVGNERPLIGEIGNADYPRIGRIAWIGLAHKNICV